MDLKGRLSNPLEIAEALAAQGSERVGGSSGGVETTRVRPSDDRAERPREEKGRLSNPPQRRLSPSDIDDLVKAYQGGATIRQLAVEFGVHRTTVADHLDSRDVPRHHERTTWDDVMLRQAADLYATGLSLARVADRYDIDAQAVANRLRRAGIPIRSRRGSLSRRTPAHG